MAAMFTARRFKTYFLCGIWLATFSAAHAQMLKYNSTGELFGAAAASPDSVGQLIQRLVDLCSTYSPAVQVRGDDELKKWLERHRTFLEEGAIVKQEYLAIAQAPHVPLQQREMLKNMMEVVIPKTIDKQFEAMTTPIKEIGFLEGQISLCQDYFQAIAIGKFDLRRNDATLSAYLDHRISKRNSLASHTNDAVSLAAAQQQLLGQWQHAYLLRTVDGTLQVPQPAESLTTTVFLPDGTWTSVNATFRSSGTYRWLDAQRIEQSVKESTIAIQIGTATVKQVRLSADRLEIITLYAAADLVKTMPPAQPGVVRPNEVVVTSVFYRNTTPK